MFEPSINLIFTKDLPKSEFIMISSIFHWVEQDTKKNGIIWFFCMFAMQKKKLSFIPFCNILLVFYVFLEIFFSFFFYIYMEWIINSEWLDIFLSYYWNLYFFYFLHFDIFHTLWKQLRQCRNILPCWGKFNIEVIFHCWWKIYCTHGFSNKDWTDCCWSSIFIS
jgi:hypothetical protein